MSSMTHGRRSKANRYVAESLATASPAALLVMLYDRLVIDLQRAEQALEAGDRETAHTSLTHAQDIVLELQNSLRVDAWDGGPGLMSLYSWLMKELIATNTTQDAARAAACRVELVEPLAEAWRQAATEHLTGGR
ncbi:flagellar protein FliS [Kineococcus xinjiangensis]|uniref:Flagellar protein FliS n=1 Tax=Kineococcus xinjiangensis TaxID=512762 RepID=A0A2S6IJZ4_9ACTN|nr:flagellar export chaperone FliS [Kineococcus xinjiangensis]PPK94501.1 flagellar protein FliS [Kineococcus xinjiangensis]